MSILWFAAGEEIEFGNRHSSTVSTAAGAGTYYRSAYVRATLQCPNLTSAVEADGLPLAAPVTSAWLSGQFYPGGGTQLFGLGKFSLSAGGIFLTASGGTNKWQVAKVSSTGTKTILATETLSSFAGTLTRVDMQITGFNTASAAITVYLGGSITPTVTWTGDLTGLGFTDLDCFRYVGDSSATVGGGPSRISEIIIATEDTRAFFAVATLAGNAAGDTNTFDSGAYTDVNEIVLNDATLLASGTAAQEFETNLNDLPAGDFTIRGVKVTARASKGVSGPGTLKLGIKTGGTVDTVDKALSTSLQSYERVMETNPVTGQRFTTAEINALQLALKSAT